MRMRRWTMALGVLVTVALAGATPTAACTVCFGEAQGPVIEGAKALVWVMAGITLFLQGVFIWFFLNLRRRAKAAPDRVLVKSRMQLIKGAK